MKTWNIAPVVAVCSAFILAATPDLLCAQQSFSLLSPEQQEVDAAIMASLGQIIECNFAETPLNEVVEYLSDRLEIPFHMDRNMLETAGVMADSPVKFSSKRLPAKDAMSLLLGSLDLGWIVENGTVIVTTKDAERASLITRVYLVKDLAPKDQSPWGEELTKAITGVLSPTSWTLGPGMATGLMRQGDESIATVPSVGVIVVSQTRAVHEQIAGLLAALRAAREQ